MCFKHVFPHILGYITSSSHMYLNMQKNGGLMSLKHLWRSLGFYDHQEFHLAASRAK
jgi:hypothetical protein